MCKFLFIVVMSLSLGMIRAKEPAKTFNRYGMALVKEGREWSVRNEAEAVERFGFDPDTVPGWREPWRYVPGRIHPGDLEKCTVRSFDYKRYPAYACRMDVYLPAGRGRGPFPFMLFIHGGGWTTGHEKTPNMVLPASWFASNGIAVMSVSYTLSGQGTFEDTCEDLRDALTFIRTHASEWGVDAGRFGFYGFSAGGHLASWMALTTPGTRLFISSAGPVDMVAHGRRWLDERKDMVRYFGFSSGDMENLRRASPLFIIPQPGSRIPAAMIIQGLMDPLVDPRPSLDFAAELKAKGAAVVELRAVPYGPHGVVNPRFYRYEEFMFDMLDFVQKHL